MFSPNSAARVFGVPPGVDFPQALVDGLRHRSTDKPPETLARVDLIVNTARMERRLRQIFDNGPAALLPKIHLLTHLDMIELGVALPPAASPLRQRLELIALVSGLIEQQPDLAPRTSLYALTDSLASLLDEMQGEGVRAEDIANLDVSDQSGHWQRAQTFITIAQDFLRQSGRSLDQETRQRKLVEALIRTWEAAPPERPVILAGSTGSRGTTLMLMEAIARLPQGAVVLPGFDFDLPEPDWAQLGDALSSEDHPQYRFHQIMKRLRLSPGDITPWHDTEPPHPTRNALISLSLRPAPVTHAWLTEGPSLRDLPDATAQISLLEAPDPRTEALCIALRLRKAVEDGQTATVISPDRVLTRQIAASLDRWGILPDDSAGAPLHLSPPGRFLRHIAGLFHRRLDAESLLTLLKHPLSHSGGDRGAHVLNTQRLEMAIRKTGLPYPDPAGLGNLMRKAAASDRDQQEADRWVAWVANTFCGLDRYHVQPLSDWVHEHMDLAEIISRGSLGSDPGEVWKKKAGQKALEVIENLRRHADHAQPMNGADYATLIGALLADGEVRDRDAPHPGVKILGTLEARVHDADLVILAGLNEGTWPAAPDPDPWLNRALRHQAGLLLPERRIGLAAHDFQQAVAAPEVWITRAIRSDDAETVAARWVNRLCNLLDGLKAQDGPHLLTEMKARGQEWIETARRFEAVVARKPAVRPSPRPPAHARPKQMAVTDIKHLVRDPYAIYAKHVLRLRKLGPLLQHPDALSRGTASHSVMETYVRKTCSDTTLLSPEALVSVAENVLASEVPWPAARALWLARLQRISEWFVENERQRRLHAAPVAFEDDAKGSLDWPDIGFRLAARADRIDQAPTGDVLLYDYKTGQPPSEKQQRAFDKQLLIEAAMITQGDFDKIGKRHVRDAVFIGLGAGMTEVSAPLTKEPPEHVLTELRQLIVAYLSPSQGFTARRMMEKDSHASDYDLLARFGEWDMTDPATPVELE